MPAAIGGADRRCDQGHPEAAVNHHRAGASPGRAARLRVDATWRRTGGQHYHTRLDLLFAMAFWSSHRHRRPAQPARSWLCEYGIPSLCSARQSRPGGSAQRPADQGRRRRRRGQAARRSSPPKLSRTRRAERAAAGANAQRPVSKAHCVAGPTGEAAAVIIRPRTPPRSGTPTPAWCSTPYGVNIATERRMLTRALQLVGNALADLQ